jgi:hypothetical protein
MPVRRRTMNDSVLWASHPPAIGARRYSEGAGVRLRPLYDAHHESLISLLHSNCSKWSETADVAGGACFYQPDGTYIGCATAVWLSTAVIAQRQPPVYLGNSCSMDGKPFCGCVPL